MRKLWARIKETIFHVIQSLITAGQIVGKAIGKVSNDA